MDNLNEQLTNLNNESFSIPEAELMDTTIMNESSGMPDGVILTSDNASGLGIQMADVTTSELHYELGVDDSIIGLALDESGKELLEPVINPDFVEKFFEAQKLADNIYEQIDEAKSIIKKFIETHDLGSIESNGMTVKYTPATTTTTLDSAKIKSKYPDIAAECSKVSARKSSISIKES